MNLYSDQKYWDSDTFFVVLALPQHLKCTMTMGPGLSSAIWGYFHPYRLNRFEITAPFVRSPYILGDQKYWDKFTYMCVKVVKS
jgi:hypothetical protein